MGVIPHLPWGAEGGASFPTTTPLVSVTVSVGVGLGVRAWSQSVFDAATELLTTGESADDAAAVRYVIEPAPGTVAVPAARGAPASAAAASLRAAGASLAAIADEVDL